MTDLEGLDDQLARTIAHHRAEHDRQMRVGLITKAHDHRIAAETLGWVREAMRGYHEGGQDRRTGPASAEATTTADRLRIAGDVLDAIGLPDAHITWGGAGTIGLHSLRDADAELDLLDAVGRCFDLDRMEIQHGDGYELTRYHFTGDGALDVIVYGARRPRIEAAS